MIFPLLLFQNSTLMSENTIIIEEDICYSQSPEVPQSFSRTICIVAKNSQPVIYILQIRLPWRKVIWRQLLVENIWQLKNVSTRYRYLQIKIKRKVRWRSRLDQPVEDDAFLLFSRKISPQGFVNQTKILTTHLDSFFMVVIINFKVLLELRKGSIRLTFESEHLAFYT